MGLNRALAFHRMGCSYPPNAVRISRAATIDRDRLHAMIPRKMATISLAGTASGCMRWLGGTTPEGRDALPDVLAPEGATWDGVRMRFFPALTGVMTVGCVPRDGARGRCPRWRSHHDNCRMRCLGWRSDAFPALACPGNACVARDGARMPDSHALAVRPQQSRG
jgi:hypothetical protein